MYRKPRYTVVLFRLLWIIWSGSYAGSLISLLQPYFDYSISYHLFSYCVSRNTHNAIEYSEKNSEQALSFVLQRYWVVFYWIYHVHQLLLSRGWILRIIFCTRGIFLFFFFLGNISFSLFVLYFIISRWKQKFYWF